MPKIKTQKLVFLLNIIRCMPLVVVVLTILSLLVLVLVFFSNFSTKASTTLFTQTDWSTYGDISNLNITDPSKAELSLSFQRWSFQGEDPLTTSARKNNYDYAINNGNTMTVWIDDSGAVSRLIIQRFDENGNRLWGDEGIVLNDGTGDGIKFDGVVSIFYNTSTGGAYISWDDSTMPTTNTHIQQINSSGNILWPMSSPNQEGIVFSGNTARLVSDNNNGIIVVYNYVISNNGVYAQRINEDGIRQWCTYLHTDGVSYVDPLYTGTDEADCGTNSYFSSIDGIKLSSQWISVNYTKQQIIHEGASNLYVMWASTGSNRKYIQKFDINGNYGSGGGYIPGTAGMGGVWSNDGIELAIFTDNDDFSVAPDGSNGVVAVWQKSNNIEAVRVDYNGNLPWGVPIEVSDSTNGDNKTNSSTALSGGYIYTAFSSEGLTGDNGYHVQKIDPSDGSVLWGSNGLSVFSNNINMDDDMITISKDGNDGFYAVYSDINNDSIIAQKFNSDGSIDMDWDTSVGSNGELIDQPVGVNPNPIPQILFDDSDNNIYIAWQRWYTSEGTIRFQRISPLLDNRLSGYITSSVINTADQHNWDNLDWEATIPGMSTIKIEARSSVSDPLNYSLGLSVNDDDTDYFSSYFSVPGNVFPPSFAINGSYEATPWLHKFANSDFSEFYPVSPSNPQYFRLDLGEDKQIQKFVIRATDIVGGEKALLEYKFQTSTDGVVWSDLIDNGSIVDQNNDTDVSKSINILLSEAIQSRYIGIYITDAEPINVGSGSTPLASFEEFEIYSSDSAWSCNWGSCPSIILTSTDAPSGSMDISSLPTGQYFQYKITMMKGSTPILTSVSISGSLLTPPPPPSAYTIPEEPDEEIIPEVCSYINMDSLLGSLVFNDANRLLRCDTEGIEGVDFVWTAPESGRYRFQVYGSNFIPEVIMFNDNCDGQVIAYSEDAKNNPPEINLSKNQIIDFFVRRTDVCQTSTDFNLNISRIESQSSDLYTVQSGDYLSLIAERLYGNKALWTELVAKNKRYYPTLERYPSLLYAGWQLRY